MSEIAVSPVEWMEARLPEDIAAEFEQNHILISCDPDTCPEGSNCTGYRFIHPRYGTPPGTTAVWTKDGEL